MKEAVIIRLRVGLVIMGSLKSKLPGSTLAAKPHLFGEQKEKVKASYKPFSSEVIIEGTKFDRVHKIFQDL
jgi:hypothetical protein